MIPVDDGGTSQLSPLHSTVHLGPDRDTKESLVQTREKVDDIIQRSKVITHTCTVFI